MIVMNLDIIGKNISKSTEPISGCPYLLQDLKSKIRNPIGSIYSIHSNVQGVSSFKKHCSMCRLG